MSVACPNCGSRFLRESKPRADDPKKRFASPLRCQDCKTRFIARTFIVSDLKWARCPKCARMDLNGWAGKTCEPPLFMAMKISLGAERWRCEYCRVNFASFRPRKELFTFRRWDKLRAGMSLSDRAKPPRREEPDTLKT